VRIWFSTIVRRAAEKSVMAGPNVAGLIRCYCGRQRRNARPQP